MIHHHQNRSFPVAAAFAVVFGFSVMALAELPESIVTSPDLSPSDIEQVDKFVDAQIAGLISTDLTRVMRARHALVDQSHVKGATPGFLVSFAESANRKLLPWAGRNIDARIRLNVAIVTAGIAFNAQNSSLAPITKVLLNDGNEAVALWGLQSAKVVVPLLLNPNLAAQQAANPALAVNLGQDVVRVAAQPSEAAIEEAYRTVLLNSTLGGGHGVDYLNGINPAALRSFLPVTIALFQARVGQYNLAVPPQPTADWWCCKFFVNPTVWSAATPAQQKQLKALMVALAKGAAMQKAAAPERAKECLEVIQRTGSAFQLLGGALKNKSLQESGKGVAGLTTLNSDKEIKDAIDGL